MNVVTYLNINSVRNKFTEMSEILTENLLDVFFISETKLDNSFPSPQFNIPDYKLHRADKMNTVVGLWRTSAVISRTDVGKTWNAS